MQRQRFTSALICSSAMYVPKHIIYSSACARRAWLRCDRSLPVHKRIPAEPIEIIGMGELIPVPATITKGLAKSQKRGSRGLKSLSR